MQLFVNNRTLLQTLDFTIKIFKTICAFKIHSVRGCNVAANYNM